MYSVPLLTFNLLIFLFISLWTHDPILIHGLDPITLTYLYASIIPDLSNGSHFLLCPAHGNSLLLSDTQKNIEAKLLLFLSQPWGYLIFSRPSCFFQQMPVSLGVAVLRPCHVDRARKYVYACIGTEFTSILYLEVQVLINLSINPSMWLLKSMSLC